MFKKISENSYWFWLGIIFIVVIISLSITSQTDIDPINESNNSQIFVEQNISIEQPESKSTVEEIIENKSEINEPEVEKIIEIKPCLNKIPMNTKSEQLRYKWLVEDFWDNNMNEWMSLNSYLQQYYNLCN